MAFNFGRSSAQTDQVNYYSKKNSSELPNGPSDSVSQLAWSGDGQALACASWDRTCRVWQITNQPAPFGSTAPIVYKGNPQSLFTETAPVLSCCFGDTTQMLLTGGCDKQVKAYDLISGRSTGQVIGQHDSPVNFVAWNPMFKLICKAAFHDCFLGICDTFRDCLILNIPRILQQGQSAFAATTPSAAAASSIPIVTRAGSQYQKMQNRSIAFFPDDASQSPGAVIGSVEGRCSIVYIKEEHKSMDFSYRCHRQDVPQQGMQIFSGADGVIICWDKDSRQKLKTFESAGAPIADLKYDPTSTALAYAVSYDWNKASPTAPSWQRVSGSNCASATELKKCCAAGRSVSTVLFQGPDQQELAKGHHVYIHAMKEEDLRPRRRLAERTFEHSGAGRSVVRTTFRLMQNSTDPQAGFAPADTIAQEKLSTTQNDPLIQYVVLRQDLATELKWPLGAVVAQACHAAVDALGLAMEADKETARRYLAAGSSMRTVVLQVANEAELLKLQDKLKKNHIGHKLWQEEPENIPTALASVPIQKSAARVFRGFKLLS
ncbi:hypothetical protein cyc_04876 [Cyclospora cayetanensis]|uniref:peptidyl-tRNA hydrolase n=1 Tax=Cyclospora cayetanensis TaxID=88456 RepID=A0A1D3CW19_9EIME|nr:hypothetical protein cyc_04876 [Cyclospora cayetanensis]